MKLQPVESSMIQAVGYDEEAEALQVRFNSGQVYEYSGVPKMVFDRLMAAESKGSFMHEAIIDCYPYRKIRHQRI